MHDEYIKATEHITKPASLISKQLKLIDERLGELSQVSDNFQSRLANILSDSQPTTGCDNAEKPHFASALEGTLSAIREKVETEISRLQNLTSRLTI